MFPRRYVGLLVGASLASLPGCGGSTAVEPSTDAGALSDSSSVVPPGTDSSSGLDAAGDSPSPGDAAMPPKDAAPSMQDAADPTCEAAGGTCGYVMAGFCTDGTQTSLWCGGDANVLCCQPGDAGPNNAGSPCEVAGGLCLESCPNGFAAQPNFACDQRTCCMELGGGASKR